MNTLTLVLLVVVILIILLNAEIDNGDKEKFAIPYGSRYGGYSRQQHCNKCKNFYFGDRCLSPYCEKEWWWYNDHTPLPWGNSSRTPKWFYPPYTYVQSYYDGWF